MKRFRSWVAGVGLCAAVAPAVAIPVLLDFEGIANTAQIHTFYGGINGGGDSTPTSSPVNGTDFGVTFATGPLFGATSQDIAGAVARANDSVVTPGSLFGFLANAGSLETPHEMNQSPYPELNLGVMDSGGLISGSPSFAKMTSAATFALNSLSFWYSSSQIGARVVAFNSNDEVVGSFVLPHLIGEDNQFEAGCDNNPADPPFCNWTKVTGSEFLAGTGTGPIKSLQFYNDTSEGTLTLYDNIQFNTATAVPEPSTYALMALGLLGIALNSLRRRES